MQLKLYIKLENVYQIKLMKIGGDILNYKVGL
jgi:hypothetical protein